MLLIDLRDAALFRRLLGLHQDLVKWNTAIEKYLRELYPDAQITFSQQQQCWMIPNSDVVYFVDVEHIMTKEDFGFCWSGDEAIRKIYQTNELMLKVKGDSRH